MMFGDWWWNECENWCRKGDETKPHSKNKRSSTLSETARLGV